MSTPTHLYRYTDHEYASIDEFDQVRPCLGRVEAGLRIYSVIGETPCGYHVTSYGAKHWVSKTSKKRLAYPSREEAWTSFKARKTRQVAILKARLRRAEAALRLTQLSPHA